MYDEHQQLDDELAHLAGSLRGGDHMMACWQLAELARKLDHSIRREVHDLARADALTLVKLRTEHTSMRRLVSLIASALDRADDRRALEVVGKLRSVLLLHVAKEALLLPALHDHA